MMKWLPLGIALVVVFLGYDSVFEIHEGERGLIQQFGEIKPQDYRAGLHLKWPCLQQVVRLDRRVQAQTLPLRAYPLADRSSVETSVLLHWRVDDDAAFYRSARGDRLRVRRQLAGLAVDVLAGELRRHTLVELVAESAGISAAISKTLAQSATKRGLGIAMLDVAIKQIRLRDEALTRIYQRMQGEQVGMIERLRVDGAAQARRIHAEADQRAALIDAEAEQRIARMQGDSEARIAALYARASARDPEFFAFYRSLQAYRDAFGQGGNVWILTPETGLLYSLAGQNGISGALPRARHQ